MKLSINYEINCITIELFLGDDLIDEVDAYIGG